MYNATRFLLEAEYRAPAYGSWVSNYDASHDSDWHVVKIHDEDDQIASRAEKILTSHRDIRDIAASAWLREWVGTEHQVLEFVESVVRCHIYWVSKGAFDLSYRTIKETPLLALRSMAEFLGCSGDVDLAAIVAQIEALPMPEAGRNDPVTLLWGNHSMNGGFGYYKDVLSPSVITRVETVFDKWLRENRFAV